MDKYDLTLLEIEELSFLSIMSLYQKGYGLDVIAEYKGETVEYIKEWIDYCCQG